MWCSFKVFTPAVLRGQGRFFELHSFEENTPPRTFAFAGHILGETHPMCPSQKNTARAQKVGAKCVSRRHGVKSQLFTPRLATTIYFSDLKSRINCRVKLSLHKSQDGNVKPRELLLVKTFLLATVVCQENARYWEL